MDGFETLKRIADDFRRLNADDAERGERHVMHLSADAARTLADAGYLAKLWPNWNRPASTPMDPNLETARWELTWRNLVGMLTVTGSIAADTGAPTVTPRADGNGYRAALYPADWRVRAAQYARLCDELIGNPLVRAEGDDFAHSEDFASVYWYGEAFQFTPTQAACIKALWQAMENKSPVLFQATILELADSSQRELRQVFRGHAAWNNLVVPAGKGAFRLNIPKQF